MGHVKTQIFSLVGRHIILNKPYFGFTEGVIVEQLSGSRFGCHLQAPDGRVYQAYTNGPAVTVDFSRGEFRLPPLSRYERHPVILPDDSDGFAYADVPNF